ncbi:MAG: PilZ domain-containing protein [Treponema sp.]|nr:PilZ domain-containing protein [Treponema sp.]
MTSLMLYPLQVSVTDFQMDSSLSPRDMIISGLIAAVIIGVLVIINKTKKPSTGGKTGSSGGGGLFAGFTLYRLTKDIGFNHEQKKMLDYVFKTDGVTEPEKSLNTPFLMDRHFRKAYRTIEQTGGSDAETQRKLAILFSTRNLLENSTFGGITSTQQIRDDATFIFNNGKDKISTAVISTRGDNVAVETPKNVLGSQIKIPKGAKLSIMFFTKNNKGYSFETRVTGFTTMHGRHAMLLAHSNQIKFLSQRRHRRRHAVIACSLNLVYVEGSGKKARLIVDKRKFSANIADISIGGCSIKITTPVQVGARFKVEFNQNDNSVAALGQVLRTNKNGVNTIIHIKFLRVTQKSMNLINAFVYEYTNE